MKRRASRSFFVGAGLLLAFLAGTAHAQITPPVKRRQLVELATRLAEPPAPAALPETLVNPFNPPAFAQPDPEEMSAIAETPSATVEPTRPAPTAMQLLEQISARITPSGTVVLRGEPYLIFGQKRLRVGDQFTVTFGEQDYTLDLVAIDRSTFTLRLGRDTITRSIKPGRTP